VHAQVSWLELGDDLTTGPAHQRVEGWADTLSGSSRDGPWAKSGAGLNRSPTAFSFFLFFFLFPFLIYHFFYIVCKNASKQFKPFLEIF
jgi:hypothetical protein